MKKAMVIGISPDYNYPGTMEAWGKRNTFYASNFGASLIVRALMKIFDADYVSDFSDPKGLSEKYDLCIIGFATHITSWRDVSRYADFAEKLDMKVIAPSLGIQDYSQKTTELFRLDRSMKRLLDIVTERSEWMGVRGAYTASVLHKEGFKNVLPIGCPTVFSTLKDNIVINKQKEFNKPVIVYQQNFSEKGYALLENALVLGQDFVDEPIFTDRLKEDVSLQKMQKEVYSKFTHEKRIRAAIAKNGKFPENYDDWFNTIGEHDLVVGTRLHGVVAGLLRNIPSVLIPRDIRTVEITSFYNLPTIDIEKLDKYSFQDIYNEVDFSKFNKTYKKRYANFYHFLEENEVKHGLEAPTFVKSDGFEFMPKDITTNNQIIYQDILNSQIPVETARIAAEEKANRNAVKETLKKIPYLTTLYHKIKG